MLGVCGNVRYPKAAQDAPDGTFATVNHTITNATV